MMKVPQLNCRECGPVYIVAKGISIVFVENEQRGRLAYVRAQCPSCGNDSNCLAEEENDFVQFLLINRMYSYLGTVSPSKVRKDLPMLTEESVERELTQLYSEAGLSQLLGNV